MSAWSFWFWLERLAYRLTLYCHVKKDKAFDRDLDREIERMGKGNDI